MKRRQRSAIRQWISGAVSYCVDQGRKQDSATVEHDYFLGVQYALQIARDGGRPLTAQDMLSRPFEVGYSTGMAQVAHVLGNLGDAPSESYSASFDPADVTFSEDDLRKDPKRHNPTSGAESQPDSSGSIIEGLSDDASPQAIWNETIRLLTEGMIKMSDVMTPPRSGGFSQADTEFIGERFVNAMWGLEWLSANAHGDVDTAALAQSVRDMLEGLANGESERVVTGYSATDAQLRALLPPG